MNNYAKTLLILIAVCIGLYVAVYYVFPWLWGLFLILLPFIIIAGLFVAYYYNNLTLFLNRVEEMISNIDVELERKHSLIEQLIEQVKQYSSHESGTLNSVIAARLRSQSAEGYDKKAESEHELNTALTQLYALAESYPELKANNNYMRLQQDITETENRITTARYEYNSTVRSYNNCVRQIPSNLIAKLFAFDQLPYFKRSNE